MSNQVFKPDPNQDPAERMLRFFASQHLSEELRPVVERFRSNAVWLLREVPRGPERTAGMRKLLEAKDCFVRACLEDPWEPKT